MSSSRILETTGRVALAFAAMATPALAHHDMHTGLVKPVLAHHAMDGGLVQTFAEGLISGLAHPVIGMDHLAAILALGIIAAAAGAGLALPVAFVAASAVGVGLHLALVDIPMAEVVVAGSVLLLGALLLARLPMSRMLGVALGGLAGLFHGYAYGESIVGAEPTPILAYLIGLAVVQLALAVGAFLATRFLLESRAAASANALRFAGIAVMAVGGMALMAAI